MKRTLALSLLLFGCGSEPVAQETKPLPSIHKVAPGFVPESKSSELITYWCLDPTEPNHMAGKPASGCPLQDTIGVTDPESLWGMEYYQRFRRSELNIPCAEMRDYAQTAAALHSVYMSAHGSFFFGHSACFMDGHSEKTGCDYFSGVSPRDQIVNNGMPTDWDEWNGQVTNDGLGCVIDASKSAAGWMAAPFHREAWMDPSTDFAGFATFWQNHQAHETWANTMQFSRRQDWQDDGSNDPAIVRYPKRNDTGVPRWFSGVETPAPPRPPSGWPSGYPVSVWAKPGTATWTNAKLCTAPSGNQCVTPVPSTKILGSNVVHIYANTKMTATTRYWVQFLGVDGDGNTISQDWTFTTGLK